MEENPFQAWIDKLNADHEAWREEQAMRGFGVNHFNCKPSTDGCEFGMSRYVCEHIRSNAIIVDSHGTDKDMA